jgi:hypothetical protein
MKRNNAFEKILVAILFYHKRPKKLRQKISETGKRKRKRWKKEIS